MLTPSEESLKEANKRLFAASGRGVTIVLPTRKKEKISDHTLPDDKHFSSRGLVTAFFKPNFVVS